MKQPYSIHFSLVLLFAYVTTIHSQTIIWNTDTTNNFELTAAGTGAIFNANDISPGGITSPSGLWNFEGLLGVITQGNQLHILSGGRAKFLLWPQVSWTYPSSSLNRANFPSTAPWTITDGGEASMGYVDPWQFVAIPDASRMTLTYINFPDPLNPETWEWTFNAYGAQQIIVIPEPSMDRQLVLLMGGLLCSHLLKTRKIKVARLALRD